MKLLRSLLVSVTARVDQWMHFHRFNCRTMCDLHDLALHTELRSLVQDRREGRRPHARIHSYRRHPSTQGADS